MIVLTRDDQAARSRVSGVAKLTGGEAHEGHGLTRDKPHEGSEAHGRRSPGSAAAQESEAQEGLQVRESQAQEGPQVRESRAQEGLGLRGSEAREGPGASAAGRPGAKLTKRTEARESRLTRDEPHGSRSPPRGNTPDNAKAPQVRDLRGFQLVREGGVEPPRPFGHWNLNPARLPIPPPAHWVCRPSLTVVRAPADIQNISTLSGVDSHPFPAAPGGRRTPLQPRPPCP